MPRPKKSWKFEEKKIRCLKEPKNQNRCRDIDPNQLKDRAIHEGDNPLF
jgi:hypothetical protein